MVQLHGQISAVSSIRFVELSQQGDDSRPDCFGIAETASEVVADRQLHLGQVVEGLSGLERRSPNVVALRAAAGAAGRLALRFFFRLGRDDEFPLGVGTAGTTGPAEAPRGTAGDGCVGCCSFSSRCRRQR